MRHVNTSDSTWFSSYSKKLRFFARVRRFLQRKTGGRKSIESCGKAGLGEAVIEKEGKGGEEEALLLLQRSVKGLHFGNKEEKEVAAKEIRRLAQGDLRTRKSLAGLGVVPALVRMLDSDVSGCRISAIQALAELAGGSHTNRVLMVEGGILPRLSNLVAERDPSATPELTSLLVHLSSLSLAHAQVSIPTSDILPFVIKVVDSTDNEESKSACLATLFNLSTVLDNASAMVSGGAAEILIRLSLDKGASEKALATLGNLVVSISGKQALEAHPSVPNNFIQVLTWEEKPRCQELSAYLLMILAHGSPVQREKMARSGIVPVLLEVALLGSPLAQKRAMKILQWFKDERQKRIGPHSGPQTGRVSTGSAGSENESKEGMRLIKMMVKQSLDKNMESILKRANIASEDRSKLKGLIVSSRSKSLPY